MKNPTKDEVIQYVATKSSDANFQGKWYQGGIELPHGVVTENPYGEVGDCRRIWPLLNIAQEEIFGKTMLDVGCCSGFYAMEWVRNGGVSAHGFDSGSRYIEAAAQFAQWRGLTDATFETSDFWDFDWDNASYDAVFAPQVLYHIENPKRALDMVAGASKDLVLLILKSKPPLNFWTEETVARQLEKHGFKITYFREGTTVHGKMIIKAKKELDT